MSNSNDTWYVIADGVRACVYRLHKGSGEEPRLEHLVDRTADDLLDDGPSGVQPPEASIKDIDEATFAKQLGQYLNRQKYAGAFQSMVLVADPSTLGQLRHVLDDRTQACITAEHSKTLTTASMDEIHRSLF